MRPCIAYVTSGDGGDHPDWPLLRAAFDRVHIDLHPLAWDGDSDWTDFDLVFIGTGWGAADRRQAFLKWAREVEDQVPLANPATVLVQNTDLAYLRDFERKGLACVPALWFEPGDEVGFVERELQRCGWSDFQVATNVPWQGFLVREHQSVEDVVASVAAITNAGRIAVVRPGGPDCQRRCVVVIGDAVSHVVDPDSHAAVPDIDPEVAQLALRTVAAGSSGERLVGSRVDLRRIGDNWLVEALAACGPDLYLSAWPASADKLARTVKAVVMPDERH